jgi:DNA repair exonuclease SbcCD ATPase subunit
MAPIVERLQVEEGFLDGLDLRLSPGLNVIIGPRGVGKTSIIELTRFCLGVKGVTEEFDERSREHALSVLGPGRVSVTVVDGEREILVSRSANDDAPRSSSRYRPPLVLSQSEIERVGLEARGRLRIIDGFADEAPQERREEKGLEAGIRSYTLQVRQLAQDLDATNEQIALLASVPEELKAAIQAQQSVLRTFKQSEKQQARLKTLGADLAVGSVRVNQLDQAIGDIDGWRKDIRLLLRKPPRLSDWPAAAGSEDLLASARTSLRRVSQIFEEGLGEIDRAIKQIEDLRATSQAGTLKLEEEARKLRRELEQLKTGAGAATQKVGALQEKALQLEALQSRTKELTTRIQEARAQRGEVLTELQRVRDERYQFRSNVARTLTKELGPSIEITVEQGGDAPGYVGTIQAAIRGSGLHYNTLAPQLAQAMSPRELAEAVESGDRATIARLTGISEDRAAKAIAAIARVGTEDILTAQINDRVTMSLLVGQEYRPTTELSMGQRCTVVLSTLLGYQGRGLVIDQPEDHLDNAFIVDTLIEAVRRRKAQTQMLFTTHNANIPVLGDADMVVLLGSDGQRGFVRHSGPLNDPAIVRAITTVMEGGQEAFERRAKFYRDWLKPGDR